MLAILLAGMMVTQLNQSLINIALPQIMTQFNIDASTAQWISTGYMLVIGILVPISAFLVQRFSYRQLFLTAMTFFTVSSFLCAVSTGFTFLLLGRMLQAVGGGILSPLSMNIFLSAFPVEKRGAAMGWLGLGIILAPAIGPTISGYVVQNYHWNILFYAMAAIGACILSAGFFFFSFKSERGDAKLDILGVIISTIGFGSLLYGVSSISSKGWNNPEVITFLFIAVVSLTAFVYYELKKKNPLLEMRVFKDFNFSYTIIVNSILQMGFYGAMLLLTFYLQIVRGFSPLDTGLLLLPGSLLMGVMGIFTGKLYDRFGIKPLAIIGMAIMTGATYMLSTLSMDTSYTEIMILYVIRSFAMSFVITPIISAGLETIPQSLIPHANALINTLRQVSGSIGTALLVIVMSGQEKNYIENLGTAVTADSANLATLHGINIAFLVATAISAVALVMSFFFKKSKVKRRI